MRAERASVLLLIPALLLAAFAPARWRWRAPVSVTASGLAAARIGVPVYAAARPDLGDLRLVRGGAEVAYVLERSEEEQQVATPALNRSEEVAAAATLLVADLGAPLPSDRVRLETPAPSFWRAVEIEASSDASHWTWAASGAFYRLPGEESLALTFSRQHCRYLRLRIANKDDPPLPDLRLAVEATALRLLFLAEARDRYWLYFGNAEASPPSYDLARILARGSTEPLEAAIGPPAPNLDYRPAPQPWTERHPEILYGVLAAAIIVLATMVVRFWITVRAPARGR